MLQQHEKKQKKVSAKRTLVFVTDQLQCERIIRTAHGLAEYSGNTLEVVSIQLESRTQDPQAIEHLFGVSRQYGSFMRVLYADDIFRTMSECIGEEGIEHVVTGMPGGEDSVLYRVFRAFPQVHFFTIAPDGEICTVSKFKPA